MTVIERINTIMKFKGIKQKDLAEVMQVKPATVSKMLNGKRQIQVYDYYIMAYVFKCSIDDLLGANALLNELLEYYNDTPRLVN